MCMQCFEGCVGSVGSVFEGCVCSVLRVGWVVF